MTRSCTICKLDGPSGRSGDGSQQDCRRCGPYVITGTARAMIGNRLDDDPLAWARASHAIRRQTSRDDWLKVGSHMVDALTGARLPSPDVQQRNLLQRVAEAAGEDALTPVLIDPDDLAGFVGVSDKAALQSLVRQAAKEGLLDAHDGRLALTHSGWLFIQPPEEAPTDPIASAQDAEAIVAAPPRVERAPCPGCGGERACDVVAEHDERIDGDDGMTSTYVSIRTLRCRGCGTLSVVRDESFSEDEDHVQDPRTGEWMAVGVVTTTRWPEPGARPRPEWLATLATRRPGALPTRCTGPGRQPPHPGRDGCARSAGPDIRAGRGGPGCGLRHQATAARSGGSAGRRRTRDDEGDDHARRSRCVRHASGATVGGERHALRGQMSAVKAVKRGSGLCS